MLKLKKFFFKNSFICFNLSVNFKGNIQIKYEIYQTHQRTKIFGQTYSINPSPINIYIYSFPLNN